MMLAACCALVKWTAYFVLMTQPVLSINEVIAARVREYRQRRGWSVRQLAEECAKHGAPQLTAASLGNIERGQDEGAKRKRREVTVAELVILGYVFDIPPVLLMFPIGMDASVSVLPDVVTNPISGLLWASGNVNFRFSPGHLPANPGEYQKSQFLIQVHQHLDTSGVRADIAWQFADEGDNKTAFYEHVANFAGALRTLAGLNVWLPPVPQHFADALTALEHRLLAEFSKAGAPGIEDEPDSRTNWAAWDMWALGNGRIGSLLPAGVTIIDPEEWRERYAGALLHPRTEQPPNPARGRPGEAGSRRREEGRDG